MRDRKTAFMWAVAWWFARRYVRRRAAHAVANVSGGVAARRRPLAAVAGALGLVAVLATAFVVWRKLSGGSAEEALPPPPPTPTPPAPPTPIHEPPPPPAAA
jgi:hypothetical protein